MKHVASRVFCKQDFVFFTGCFVYLFTVLTVTTLGLAPQAWASQSSDGFKPRTGEPLDYDKKFYPTEISRDWFLEINPLRLLGQSLVIETERRISQGLTLGLDVTYRDAEVFDQRSTTAEFSYLGVAPKMRFYPLPSLAGIFFGAKVFAGQATSEIASPGASKSWQQVVVAPAAHVGYRINFMSGVTLALYIGGGVNLPALDIDSKEFPANVAADAERSKDWSSAADKLNQQEGRFKPDWGLTIGAAF
jgi:hypothetical protein